jgi:hypothetical protein
VRCISERRERGVVIEPETSTKTMGRQVAVVLLVLLALRLAYYASE